MTVFPALGIKKQAAVSACAGKVDFLPVFVYDEAKELDKERMVIDEKENQRKRLRYRSL